jgi:hypothetical protein
VRRATWYLAAMSHGMLASTFRHDCGEEVGVSTSEVDGFPIFLTHGGPIMDEWGKSLWRVGSGAAGLADQRCPGCDAVLRLPGQVDDGQMELGI